MAKIDDSDGEGATWRPRARHLHRRRPGTARAAQRLSRRCRRCPSPAARRSSSGRSCSLLLALGRGGRAGTEGGQRQAVPFRIRAVLGGEPLAELHIARVQVHHRTAFGILRRDAAVGGCAVEGERLDPVEVLTDQSDISDGPVGVPAQCFGAGHAPAVGEIDSHLPSRARFRRDRAVRGPPRWLAARRISPTRRANREIFSQAGGAAGQGSGGLDTLWEGQAHHHRGHGPRKGGSH